MHVFLQSRPTVAKLKRFMIWYVLLQNFRSDFLFCSLNNTRYYATVA